MTQRQYPPQTGIANWRKEYTDQFVIEAADLRSLSTVPLALVTPPTATSIVVPLFVYQFLKPGSVVFDSSINPALSLDASGSLLSISLESFDGATAFAGPYDIAADNFDSFTDYAAVTGAIGSPLFLVGGGDQTGGDGTVLTLEITYAFRETAGLI